MKWIVGFLLDFVDLFGCGLYYDVIVKVVYKDLVIKGVEFFFVVIDDEIGNWVFYFDVGKDYCIWN